ncbi:MAG: Cna B-type domain-containing protein, partial [Schaalia hyovaginalis]|uniref:Cna B-type domain-containing protein n=1 Tax=Schaalia hyovaginalis TaxID=29316 RepID=UPI002A90EE88
QKLTVTIPDATAYRGQWVRVNFRAVIDAATRATIESFGADWAEIAANAPVLIEDAHAGVKNAASYRVFVKNPDGTFPQYPSGENPDDPNGGGDKPKYKNESNTVTVTPPTQELLIEKKWADDKGAIAWPAGAAVTIDVYSVKDGAETKIEGKSVTLDAATPSVKVSGLPKLIGVTYTVKESGVADNGEITIADNVYTVSMAGSTVTNTRTGEVPPTPSDNGDITPNANGKIAVQKLWKNSDGSPMAWPQGATIKARLFKADPAGGADALVTEVSLSAEQPQAVIEGLEKGATYRLVEVGADNDEFVFADDVYRVSVGGSTVTNTFDREVPPTPGGGGEEFTPNANGKIAVQKLWKDASGSELTWPAGATVTVKLYKTGAQGAADAFVRDIVLTADEPRQEVSGLEPDAKYRLVEAGTENGEFVFADMVYAVTIDGTTVTNTRTGEVPPTPSDNGDITPNANGKISVQKLWKGADGAAIAWPEGAVVTLNVVKADDGQTVKTVELASAEPVEVSGLEPGVKYGLVEVGADNGEFVFADDVYRVSVAGSTVTNTFDREVPPTPGGGGEEFTPNANGKIAVQKLWKGADGAAIAWPEGAVVTLNVVKVEDGQIAAAVELASAEPVEVSGLESGVKYRLVEAGAQNGEIVISGGIYKVSLAGTSVTNTFDREVPEDPDNPGGDNPDNPGGDDPDNPGGDNPDNPGGDNPDNPGGDNPDNPGGDNPDNPGGEDPNNPGGGTPNDPKGKRSGSLAKTGVALGGASLAAGVMAALGIALLGAVRRRED